MLPLGQSPVRSSSEQRLPRILALGHRFVPGADRWRRSPRAGTATALTDARVGSDGALAPCLPTPSGAVGSLLEDALAPTPPTSRRHLHRGQGHPALPAHSYRLCWSPR